jgi:hypothetical protein
MPEAFTNSGVRLTTTGVTTIYQAPTAANSRAVVLSSLAANASGVSSVNYSVDLTDSADTVVATIAKTIAVPANATLELIPNKVVLSSGQKLRATSSVASGIHVVTSVLEIT